MRTSLRRLVTGRNRVRRRLGRVSSQTLIGPFILHFRFSIGPCGVLLLVGCRASSSCHPPHTGDADCRSTSGPLPPQPGAQELRPEEPTRSGQFIPGRPPARRRPRRPRFRRRSSRRPGRRPSRPRRRRRRRPQGALVQGSGSGSESGACHVPSLPLAPWHVPPSSRRGRSRFFRVAVALRRPPAADRDGGRASPVVPSSHVSGGRASISILTLRAHDSSRPGTVKTPAGGRAAADDPP